MFITELLVRQCHSAVHHIASNEDLARYFHTVELLLEREDIQKWRNYASKQRFGVRWSQRSPSWLPRHILDEERGDCVCRAGVNVLSPRYNPFITTSRFIYYGRLFYLALRPMQRLCLPLSITSNKGQSGSSAKCLTDSVTNKSFLHHLRN